MLVTRGESEFEISISLIDGEWEGKIVENNLSRVVPTMHLCHNWTSRDAALAGVRRRWQRLFADEPDADRPDFQEALSEPMPSSDVSHNL
jgi:hypothetical protein